MRAHLAANYLLAAKQAENIGKAFCFPAFHKSLKHIILLAVINLFTATNSPAYEVMDSFGKHQFTEPPQRVIVTDWTLLEQLLELGITPIGAPELDNYKKWVAQPELPESIVDIGLRRSPNINTIRALKPDLIILGTDQKEFDRPFSRIARVMYYQNFSARFASNGEKSQQRLRQLATLFQKNDTAEQKIEHINQRIHAIRELFDAHFGKQRPKVTIIRLTDKETALVYGNHSMPGYVLEQLGFQSEIPMKVSKLGEQQFSINALNAVNTGFLLYIDHLDVEPDNNPRWQDLPAVKSGRAIKMNNVWSYGGAASLMYNAQAILQALTPILKTNTLPEQQ